MNKKTVLGIVTLSSALFLALNGVGGLAFADVYTLDTCPVSGGKLGAMGDPIVKDYDGTEVRFCSARCPDKFEAGKAKYTEAINAKLIAQQKPHYPLTTCVVSGEMLGGPMGEAIEHVHNNRLIRFCCEDCVKKFTKDADTFLSKLDDAVIEKQKPHYPVENCVVSGDKLGGEMGDPVEFVVCNRLIRLCCTSCKKDIEKDPAKYFSMLDKPAAGHGMGMGEGMGMGHDMGMGEGAHSMQGHAEQAPSGGHGEHDPGAHNR